MYLPNHSLGGVSVNHDYITPEKNCYSQITGLSSIILFMGWGGVDVVSPTVDEQEQIGNCYSAKKCFKNRLFLRRLYAYMV